MAGQELLLRLAGTIAPCAAVLLIVAFIPHRRLGSTVIE
jgi:hypothetical protein